MQTQTIKLDELVQALRARAATNRAKASCHRTDPELAALYCAQAELCDLEARDIECRQLLTAVQEDPFAAAMREQGAAELRLGRTDAAENGLKPAPRAVVRGQWPHGEVRTEVAAPSRWPF